MKLLRVIGKAGKQIENTDINTVGEGPPGSVQSKSDNKMINLVNNFHTGMLARGHTT